MRILIIEDEDLIAKPLRTALVHLGYAVDWEQNGKSGLQTASTNEFDCILLDLNLPEMDGIETTLRLRRLCNPDRPPPYIVAATAHVLGDSRRRFIDAGMDDFLGKPVLVDRLREVLMRAAGARPLQHRQPALVHR